MIQSQAFILEDLIDVHASNGGPKGPMIAGRFEQISLGAADLVLVDVENKEKLRVAIDYFGGKVTILVYGDEDEPIHRINVTQLYNPDASIL